MRPGRTVRGEPVMRLSWSIAAAAALLASLPAAAYNTRYEVQHGGGFTRTVNQALGTNVESYADGSVTLGFATLPSPSLSISATRASATAGSFFVEDDFDYKQTFVPVTVAAQAYLAAFGQRPTHVHILTARGVTTVSETHAFGARVSSYVTASGGFADFGCENGSGAQCGTTHYSLPLFLDGASSDPYLCTPSGCPTVAAGTGITFAVGIDAIFALNGDATRASLLIDPAVVLDPEFLRDAGLSASDFTIRSELGFGNTAPPGVPEPAAWLMLITGFAAIGIVLRRRSPVAA